MFVKDFGLKNDIPIYRIAKCDVVFEGAKSLIFYWKALYNKYLFW